MRVNATSMTFLPRKIKASDLVSQKECVISVTIGRNIGDTPMSPEKWGVFQANTEAVLSNTVGAPAFVVVGPGGSWEGIEEDSAVFTVLNPIPRLVQMKEQLHNLAKVFNQEAIAISVGLGELIE